MKKNATSQQNSEIQTNVVSTLTGGLNSHFIKLKKNKNDSQKGNTDKESIKIRAELVQSINFLRKYDDKIYAEEIYSAMKISPEYMKIKEQKKEIIEKKNMTKQLEEQFNIVEKDTLEKLKIYIEQQEKSLTGINQSVEEKDMDTLKKALSEGCAIGLFTIADNFIAQDNHQASYWGVSWEERPEYVKGNLNLEIIKKTIKALSDIQDKYSDVLKEMGVVDQVKQSIHDRRLNVEKNVKNGIYNPFTRSDAIRDESLRQMLAKVCNEDRLVLDDMTVIFDLLVQQRHQDGTNSGSFIYSVQENINEYIQQNPSLLYKDSISTISTIKYIDDKTINGLKLHDMDSEFWMNFLIQGVQNSETEKVCLDFLNTSKEEGKIDTSSVFPDAKLSNYIDFVKIFFQTKKYILRQGGIVDNEAIMKELHDAYNRDLSYNELVKQNKTKAIGKAKNRAKTIFKKLSPEEKKEYFKKAYDKSRGQNHSTGLYSFQEFNETDAMAVISEHSYWSSRGGIERDSQLCVYTDGGTKKSSTGYQNYRDRFDASRDNYNNQYIEVLEIKKENDMYNVKVKTGGNTTKNLKMSPKENYDINMNVLSSLSSVSLEDKNIFVEAVKYQKELIK